MILQLNLFDVCEQLKTEPEVGEYVKEPGAVICHIMRRGYIGKKVLIDVSTTGMTMFQCGILEDYIPYEGRMRSIVFTGKKQRSLITHYPGIEIFEPMPWAWYEARLHAIGGKDDREAGAGSPV